VRLNIVATKHNAHELDAMRAMAAERGLAYMVYKNMSPTIHGGPESLLAQAGELLSKRRPLTGCNAGHTFFHVDPTAWSRSARVGRDPQIPLMEAAARRTASGGPR
jgi:MoaA/NifB/PqqE/SkfB family radical SAM enzyme